MATTILLINACPGGTEPTNILIRDGRIAAMAPTLVEPADEIVDCAGAQVLPSFIDAHVHLDKTRIGDDHRLHHIKTATVAQRAANERELRRKLRHDPRFFGSNLLRQLAVMGTTHVRSHIDIDPEIKLNHVEAILEIREQFRPYMEIQLVAFPQSGIVKSPGVIEYMAEALAMGVDLIGGLDPQTFDNDLNGNLNAIFALAEKAGVGLDIHLHEPGETGLVSLMGIIERARALGMKDMVTISHCFALGQIDQARLDTVLPQIRDLGISIVTSAPGGIDFPPVEKLLKAGVLYAGVSDNIQDMWSPWGNGDQLERAMLLAYRNGFRADELIRLCYEMVTSIPAQLFNLEGHSISGLRPGAPANLTAFPAEDVESAVLQRPPRLFTIKEGRFIAKEGQALIPV